MSKLIGVTTDFEPAATMSLRVEINVVTPVKILPQMRLSLNGVEGQATRDGLLLRRTDGRELEVQLLTSDAPFALSIGPATGPEAPPEAARQGPQSGDLWLTATLPAEVQAVTRSGIVKVTTNHPDAPEIDLPYTMRVRPMIEARPSQVQLWVSDGDQVASGSILRLIHNAREAFPVSSVVSSHPELFTAGISDSGEPSVAHNLWVRLADGVEPGSLPIRGMVTIGVGGEPERRLEVPVVVAMRKVIHRSSVGGRAPSIASPEGPAGGR